MFNYWTAKRNRTKKPLLIRYWPATAPTDQVRSRVRELGRELYGLTIGGFGILTMPISLTRACFCSSVIYWLLTFAWLHLLYSFFYVYICVQNPHHVFRPHEKERYKLRRTRKNDVETQHKARCTALFVRTLYALYINRHCVIGFRCFVLRRFATCRLIYIRRRRLYLWLSRANDLSATCWLCQRTCSSRFVCELPHVVIFLGFYRSIGCYIQTYV